MSKSLKNFITIDVRQLSSSLPTRIQLTSCVGGLAGLFGQADAVRIHDADVECQDGFQEGSQGRCQG
jgi:hypothetical protein